MAEGTPTGQVLAHGLHVPSLGQKRERPRRRARLARGASAAHQSSPCFGELGMKVTRCTSPPLAFIV